MSALRFRDKVYLNYKNVWFVWESAWDQYRPAMAVRWTGQTFEVDYGDYTADPSSPDYGYGSDKMRELCELLTEQFPQDKAVDVRHILAGREHIEWFRDRMVAVSPCAPRDLASWKKMTGGRGRTCRAGPRNRFTKRNFLHV